MRVLIVKTSSLGDLVHCFPALSDAARAIPGIRFDWVAEQAFAGLPSLHPAVERVIPIGLRRWRKNWRRAWRKGEIQRFWRDLRRDEYDCVIDAQGLLLKSAWVARAAHGPSAGYDRHSARDRWVGGMYHGAHAIARDQHAIVRNRQLFAAVLGYALDAAEPDFGLRVEARHVDKPYLVFLHATTWPSKHYPDLYWAELTHYAAQAGLPAAMPWHGPMERVRIESIRDRGGKPVLPARMELSELAAFLAGARAVIGVDSGLTHLAAALGRPTLGLYGPTAPGLSGVVGQRARNLRADFPCAPCMRRDCDYRGEAERHPACFTTLPPGEVWEAMRALVNADA